MLNNDKGFTLIEVLVAFTILSVSVGVLLVAFSGGIRNTVLTRDYTKAVIIAESRLAESGFGNALRTGEINHGTDGDYQWRTTITPVEDNLPGSWLLFDVTVKVDWEAFNGSRSVEIKSLRWGKDAG